MNKTWSYYYVLLLVLHVYIKMRTSKIMKKNMSKMKKKTMPFMH